MLENDAINLGREAPKLGALTATGIGVHAGLKRYREETGLDYSDQVQKAFKKKGQSSRPELEPLSRQNEIDNMGLLTYQRQVKTGRGRSRRRVRRLARLQRRSAYKGSSSNLIANVFPIIFPAAAAATEREGMAAYAYYTPSLAQVVEQVNKVQAQQPGSVTRYAGSYHISVPKQRFEFAWTPDWPTHGTTAVAMRVQLMKFVLKKKTPINDIICTPAYTEPNGGAIANMCHYGATNYSTAVPTGINGIPFDHTVGILGRYAAGTNAGITPTPTQWNDTRKDPLTLFESPAAVSKLTLKWTKDFYIPYGQSMAFSCGHGAVNCSYADLEINRPELFVAKTVSSNGDNFITPFLPAGWPFFVIKIQKHKAAADISVTSPVAADAINVSHRLYYRIPDFTGRMLTYNNPNSVSDAGTVPSYANVFLTANGTGKTAAYTGLNI